MLVCAVERGENVYIPDGNFVLQSGDRISVTAETQEIVKFLKMIDLAQKKARSVMILGASRTAYYLAKMLLASGNSVKIIDKDPKRCDEFCKALPKAVVINGDGAQQEVLLEEGLHSVDALVALTGLDEENILLSFFAKMQNVPHVITKINRDEFRATAEAMGIDCFVSPRKTISDRLCSYARALDSTIGSKVETLYKIMDDKAEALEFIIDEDCELIGIPLKELKLKKNTLVAGISRNRRSIIPSGNDMIMSGDKVVVITSGLRVNDIADIAE
jgi:trk system potassium uptake protein TrkA